MSYAVLARKSEAAVSGGGRAPAKVPLGNLRIGQPDDAFEQEADRAADDVMRGTRSAPEWSLSTMGIGAPLQRTCSCGGSGGSDGECEECKEKKKLQRQASGAAIADEAPETVDQVLQMPGRPLDRASRSFFESRFGHNFENVRVHTGPAADRAARDVSATAFTVGRDIAFRQGRYSPESDAGRRLLAHELAHTVQQGQAPARGVERNGSNPNTASPSAPNGVPALSRAGSSVQRIPADEIKTDVPTAITRMNPSELLKQVLDQRGWTNRAPQPLLPEGERGPDMGHGMDTHAIIQVTDKDGKVVAQELGGHLIADKSIEKSARELVPKEVGERGKVHGERMALERIRVRLADQDVRGGTMEVAVDQLPCGPEKRNCLGNLLDYAESKGLKAKIYVSDEFGHQAPGSAAAAAPEDLERQFKVYGSKGAARRATGNPAAAGTASETGSAKVLQVWPPGETYEPEVPGGSGKVPGFMDEVDELPSLNPMETSAKPQGLPDALGNKGLGTAATEGAELEGLGTGALARGSLAETALAGASSIAIDLVLLVSAVIWELVIAPKLEKLMEELREMRRRSLQAKVQEKFNLYAANKVERTVAACGGALILPLEQAGKTPYVYVDIDVVFADTSSHVLGELFGATPPESIFDIEVYDVALTDVRIGAMQQQPSVGPMTRCEDCGTFGRSRSFMTNDALWKQKVSFSFEAPKYADIAKDLPKDQLEGDRKRCSEALVDAGVKACFIATACYGSAWAPEVESLRRFRDAFLMRGRLGRRFVAMYYRFSPPVAEWLRPRSFVRGIVRMGLVGPLVRLVRGLGLDRNPIPVEIAGDSSKTGGYR